MIDDASKRVQVSKILHAAKKRAASLQLEFNLTMDYLIAIAPRDCPVLKQPLKWGVGNKENAGKYDDFSPSLDRVLPDKGYIKGNVAWISMRANMIKSNAVPEEIFAVAEWLHIVTEEIRKYGSVLPPRNDNPAFAHTISPANFVIDSNEDARQRGGY